MPKAANVDALMEALDHPYKAQIQDLRKAIRGVDDRIREEVKWNAPSFLIEDHFATFKLMPPDGVYVVLHRGAAVKRDGLAVKVDDPAGLLTWPAKDRALVTFKDAADVKAKKAAFLKIVRAWIEQTVD